jgi:hypothetical protein
MAALAAARQIQQKNPDGFKVGLGTNVIIYHGALLAKVAGGYAVPATAAASLIVLGVADLSENIQPPLTGQVPPVSDVSGQKIDMTGVSAGTKFCVVRGGVHMMDNKAGDLVTEAMVGEDVYIEDDHTVRATGTGSSVAGKLYMFDTRTLKPLVMVGVAGAYARNV